MQQFWRCWFLGLILLLCPCLTHSKEDAEEETEDFRVWKISGRVLSADGNPLEGAAVRLDLASASDESRTMTTNLQGEYETEVSLLIEEAVRLRGTLVAKKNGYREGRELLDLEEDAEEASIDIVLRTPDEDPDRLPMDTLIEQLAPRLKADAARLYSEEGNSKEFLQGCEALIDKRKAKDAVVPLRAVVERTPDCLQCRMLLSLALLDSGSWTGANNLLVEVMEENAVEDAPRSEPDCIMGVLRSWRGLIKDAVASYLQALKFDPDNALALQELGRMLVAQSNWEAADHYLSKALKAGAGNTARILRAQALLELGDAVEANLEMERYSGDRNVRDLPVHARTLHSKIRSRLALISQEQDRPMTDRSPAELETIIPELKGLQASSDQEMLAFVLDKTGAYVETFFQNMGNAASFEKVRQERFNKQGKVKEWFDQEFEYIMLADTASMGLAIKEYRSTADLRDASMVGLQKGLMLTSGFASVPSLFHPLNRNGADFRYLGNQVVDGRSMQVVAFAQKSETGRVMTRFITDKGNALVLVHGVAWIDAESFHIHRIHTYLLNPNPRLRLQKLSTKILFHEVAFSGREATLWLPREVEITVDWRGRLMRNQHHYSDYRLFNVETHNEVRAPSAASASGSQSGSQSESETPSPSADVPEVQR